MKTLTPILIAAALLAACDPESNEDTGDMGSSQGESSGTGEAETGGDETGGPISGACADPGSGPTMGISADIEGDMLLTCDTVWVLEDIIFVRGGTLTVEPGTTIKGTEGSALVIEQDSTIVAEGTADAPIVMTSIQAEGARGRGDWGGLVLLGSAPTNLEGGVGQAEGFSNPPAYGGADASHNCGSLSYLRVEWAGFAIAEGSELNGITFYACGTDTSVSYVQVHMGADDGIEMFGGDFDADHIVVTGAEDDSIDCDQGFQGSLQYVFIQQDPAIGDNAFEWSNQGTDFSATPTTSPSVANATVIGSGSGGDKSKGLTLKEGTEAALVNSVFGNFTNELVFLQNLETQRVAEGGGVVIEGNVLFDSGAPGVDDEDGSDITWTAAYLQSFLDDGGNIEGDPMLGSVQWGSPDIAPMAGSPVETGAVDPGAGFEATDYVGAVEPGGDNWTLGWTNFAS
ncbi:MAG: hypothetical protein KUG77_16260 [Nannocystaceae bacterium]|nr:hypothetical protein [Nannocystaceae bacterium]